MRLPANVQGELQGALTSMMSLTAIIGPLLMNNLFYYFTTSAANLHFPGISFLLGALLMLSALFISYKTLQKERTKLI
jgi:DHA1 family tetracycline resistance protein-like MFS transporter